MSEEYIPYFFLVFLVLFPVVWFAVIGVLLKKARMSKTLDVYTGEIVRTSGWGSGVVNGVSFKNCLRIIHTESGYIIETMKIFGGGKVWLPKKNLDVGTILPQSILKPKKVTLSSSNDSVSIYRDLADEII